MKTRKIILYSFIGAVYTVLSLALSFVSFMGVTIRIGEVLMILCLYDKEYIKPLTFACFITNLVSILIGINMMPLDLLFGTLATYLSCVLMFKLKNIKLFNKPILSLIMPCIINGLIVGSEIALYLNSDANYIVLMINSSLIVFISEFLSVFVLGLFLEKPIKSLNSFLSTLI